MNAVPKNKSAPMYSKSAVKRAGEVLLIENVEHADPNRHLSALNVLSYWRASHLSPLDVAVGEVEDVVRRMPKSAVVAKRLKRTPSIIAKLRRHSEMDLQNMQDIGGCRVIVRNIKHVQHVRRALQKRRLYRTKDYIKNAKDDGYRGVHLIGKFPGTEPKGTFHIEIQLRTVIQHSWATAVEIIDLFTRQRLKANEGKPDWQDFFRWTGEAFAELDKQRTDPNRHALACAQVHWLATKLEVVKSFAMYSRSLKILDESGLKGVEGYYLVQIDTRKSTGRFRFFPIEDDALAIDEYLQSERASFKTPQIVVALVSTDAIGGLKEAFPNYFADSEVFINHLQTILARAKVRNPSWIVRFFLSLGWGKR